MTGTLERLAVPAAMTAVAGAAAILSAHLSRGARLVPLGVALATLALLAIEIGAALRRARIRDEAAAPRSAAGEAEMLAWLAWLAGVLVAVGMAAGLPAYVLFYLRLRSGRTWRLAAGFALALWIVLSWGLQTMLGLRLHEGWVLTWMRTG